eukprot:scaffold60091_cov28-Tisochrysis_lutea.AAC.7
MKRLSSYARSLVDHHLVLDLVPMLARLRFDGKLLTPISSVQAAILVAVGLQGRDFDELHKELDLPVSQPNLAYSASCPLQQADSKDCWRASARDFTGGRGLPAAAHRRKGGGCAPPPARGRRPSGRAQGMPRPVQRKMVVSAPLPPPANFGSTLSSPINAEMIARAQRHGKAL